MVEQTTHDHRPVAVENLTSKQLTHDAQGKRALGRRPTRPEQSRPRPTSPATELLHQRCLTGPDNPLEHDDPHTPSGGLGKSCSQLSELGLSLDHARSPLSWSGSYVARAPTDRAEEGSENRWPYPCLSQSITPLNP
ncbi:protein of unknown function [Streptantibioticus cattleyicolor NRRL 8057 = DSM 46488]|nr:protein of unknown function [Streptantibioticus cattleyicolor NRRL 8057 = DSM 46488]